MAAKRPSAQEHALLVFSKLIVDGGGAFGFRGVGNVLALVENPDESPGAWRVRYVAIPYFETAEYGNRVFGVASFLEGEFAYIYGTRKDWRKGMGGRSAVVARTRGEDLAQGNTSGWAFWDGAGWSPGVERAAPLFDEAAAEMSVHFDGDRYISVKTRFGLSAEIIMRTAAYPEGPWSEASVVYRCPEADRYMTYAAKAHPELPAPPGRLVVTYATNSTAFEDHVTDIDLYWPMAAEVSLAE